MTVSAIFFLDVKGRVIVYRDYRGDISPKYAEKFMTKINEMEENSKLSPIICDEGVTYIYLQAGPLVRGSWTSPCARTAQQLVCIGKPGNAASSRHPAHSRDTTHWLLALLLLQD